MHYIRFLRPPAVLIRERGVTVLRLVFTVATDLGDAYLLPETPVPLTLTYWVNGQLQRPSLPLCKWTPGMRVCKLDVPLKVLARGSYVTKIFVSPAEANLGLMHMQQLLTLKTPMIVPALATPPLPGNEPELFTNRQVLLGDVQKKRLFLTLSEEIQDSIARRVWDGGMVTSALLFELAAATPVVSSLATELPLTKKLIASDELKVLELGCGVGTLGISMASALAQRYEGAGGEKSKHRVVMTDLPDAEEVALRNIDLYNTGTKELVAPSVSYENLDWFDCKEGVCGPLVAQDTWNLIIISDCTYNTDCIPALVGSLDKLHALGVENGGAGPAVLLSTKFRHDSESAFWDQMKTAGWQIGEKAVFDVANIGQPAEQIEVYLFVKQTV